MFWTQTIMNRPPANSRKGITLMEVLISVGVAAIGLLGVAALIPVAAYQAQEGARNDRAANVGRRSFRELRIRQYDRPGKLTFDSLGNPVMKPNWITYSSDPVVLLTTTGKFDSRAFCIDPAFVSTRLNQEGDVRLFDRPPADHVYPTDHRLPGRELFRFPRLSGTAPLNVRIKTPKMPTVSLASDFEAVPPRTPMLREQAIRAFTFEDDLDWFIPDAKTAAPSQKWLEVDIDGDGDQDPLARVAKGEFSWFFTVFGSTSDWRTVSTVITRNRVLSPNADDNQYISWIPPRQPVDPLQSAAALAADGPGFNLANDASDLVVAWTEPLDKPIKVGHWVMCSQDPTPPNPFDGAEIFAWFRVKGVGEQQVGNAGRIIQPLQLQGPAWNTGLETYMTWMPSVVAVYTREMQITAGP